MVGTNSRHISRNRHIPTYSQRVASPHDTLGCTHECISLLCCSNQRFPMSSDCAPPGPQYTCVLSTPGCMDEHVESQLVLVRWQSVLGCEGSLLPRHNGTAHDSRRCWYVPDEVWRCSPTNLHYRDMNMVATTTLGVSRPIMTITPVCFRSVADRKRSGVDVAGQRRVGRPVGDGRILTGATQATSIVAYIVHPLRIHLYTHRYIHRLLLHQLRRFQLWTHLKS